MVSSENVRFPKNTPFACHEMSFFFRLPPSCFQYYFRSWTEMGRKTLKLDFISYVSIQGYSINVVVSRRNELETYWTNRNYVSMNINIMIRLKWYDDFFRTFYDVTAFCNWIMFLGIRSKKVKIRWQKWDTAWNFPNWTVSRYWRYK